VLKTQLIEDFLDQELMQCMPDFSMKEFLSELMYVELIVRHIAVYTMLVAVHRSPLPICLLA